MSLLLNSPQTPSAAGVSAGAAPVRWAMWRHLRLAHKMAAVFGGLLLAGCLAAAAMLVFLQSVEQRTAREVQLHDARVASSQQWQSLTQQAIEAALASVQSSEEMLVQSFGQKAQQYLAQAQALLPALALPPSAATSAQAGVWTQLGAAHTALLEHYAAAYRARDLGQAWEVERIRQTQLEPAIQAYRAAQQAWLQVLADARQQASAHAAAQRGQAQLGAMVVLGILLMLAAAVAVAITRSMARPLGQAVDMAQAIAQGDLRIAHVPQAPSRDEMGRLLQAFGTMSAQLQGVVGGVRDGVAAVSGTAQTLAVGNADLAQRTQHSAAQLEQAVQGIEQLRQSVTESADHASQAHDLAASVAQTAQAGGEVVQQVVARMAQLRKHSAEIASITGLIDTIAFQTNILALNAAVEAARAGTQGRGFAVVASEVRALAQRSAEAAQQIKALVGTSLQQVADGAQWASQAGERMACIVDEVHSVSSRVGHITAAVQAQREGIAELHTAMLDLNHATQANALQVQASSEAAGALHAQADHLAAKVAVFQLGGHAAVAHMA